MERAFAVEIGSIISGSIGIRSFGDLVSSVVKNSFILAGVISFILLIFGAFQFIVGAGGEGKQMESAKNTITAAVLGLVIVIGSIFIVRVISVITGVDILNPQIR